MTLDGPHFDGRAFADPTRGDASTLVAYLDDMMSAPESAERYRLKYELLDLRPGESVLDLGCGAGADLFRMAQGVGPAGRAVGTDLNPAMVATVLERAATAGMVNVEAHVTEAGRLPFADDSFDVVHTERVLIHVADLDQTLDEMMRVLKPTGRMVCCETDFAARVIDLDDMELASRVYGPEGAGPQNRFVGRQLFRRFVRAGLLDVQVKLVPIVISGNRVLDSFEMQVGSDLQKQIDAGQITAAEAEQVRVMRQGRIDAGEFFFYTMAMLARGVKPAP